MSDYSQAIATTEIEDGRIIATRWTFPPGSATGWHRHGHDYIVVPITTSVLTIVDKLGNKTQSPITAGRPYSRGLGVEHDVVNLSDEIIEFIEIELK